VDGAPPVPDAGVVTAGLVVRSVQAARLRRKRRYFIFYAAFKIHLTTTIFRAFTPHGVVRLYSKTPDKP
jgi:hypothetical protein